MTMRNDAKMLFADLYEYETRIKENVKHVGKLAEELLKANDWDYLSKCVNVIWDEVDQIERQAGQMRNLLEKFISAGDYPGQTIQMTPTEQLAREE